MVVYVTASASELELAVIDVFEPMYPISVPIELAELFSPPDSTEGSMLPPSILT